MKCPQCHGNEAKPEFEGCCCWYCRFIAFHLGAESKKEEHQDMKEWMRLNKLMLEEKEKTKQENRCKKNLKIKPEKMKNILLEATFKSESTNDEYKCKISPSGDFCQCPGFKYKGVCKHIDELWEEYELFN